MSKVKKALYSLRHLVRALLANLRYGFPGRTLKIIGITGTDGKTTTSYMLYNILKVADKKVGLINTIEVLIDSEIKSTGLHVTTPSPWILNNLLKEMSKKKFEYVILEVTSHGIDQNRVWGIPFLVGVVTNVTNEHLDYHKDFDTYLKTKMKLLQRAKYAVVNANATAYGEMRRILGSKHTYNYGLDVSNDTSLADLKGVQLKLPGEYNKENALAAISVAKILNINSLAIKEGLEKTVAPLGRFNVIQESPVRVIVDFAHTPNSLQQVLKEVKKTTVGNLIVVFGCAGERDARKRPEMGKIASEYASKVILTAEDPRTESVSSINDRILSGVPASKRTIVNSIEDRAEAIETALVSALKGDTVIITGKGHEMSMCFGKDEYPWNDIEAVNRLLKAGVGNVGGMSN